MSRRGVLSPVPADCEPMPAWAQAFLDGVRAEVQAAVRAEVRAALREQLAPRQPAIDGDVAVGQAIAELGLTRPYSARELFALASTDATLRQALALIDDELQLGACLGRLHKRGLIDHEPRRGRHGWRWSARVTG